MHNGTALCIPEPALQFAVAAALVCDWLCMLRRRSIAVLDNWHSLIVDGRTIDPAPASPSRWMTIPDPHGFRTISIVWGRWIPIVSLIVPLQVPPIGPTSERSASGGSHVVTHTRARAHLFGLRGRRDSGSAPFLGEIGPRMFFFVGVVCGLTFSQSEVRTL